MISDRKQLEEKITEASVAMMLSVHEEFGLVGYEAIITGIPVIILKNTGLYQHELSHLVYGVDSEGSFEADGFSENDLKVVTTALINIRKMKNGMRNRLWNCENVYVIKAKNIHGIQWQKKFIEQVINVFTE